MTEPDNTHLHKCPVNVCSVQLPEHLAFCRKHWWMVPQALRDLIWSLYRTAPASKEHLAAILQAARKVESQLPPVIKQAQEDLEVLRRRQRAMAKRED